MQVLGFALVPCCLLAGAGAGAVETETGRIRKFADALFAQGEYFRAGSEYLRELAYHPDAPDADGVRFKIALCSYRARRYEETVHKLAQLASRTESQKLRDRCQLLAAACRYQQQAYRAALTACDQALDTSPGSRQQDRLLYLKGLSLLHLGQWPQAGSAFTAVPPASALAGSAGDLRGLATRATRLPHRRPWATGLLSTMVPGLGQVSCGYHWDGLTALALSGASLAVALAGVHRDNRAMVTVGFSLFGLWHTANIYGGANAARRYNRQAVAGLLAEADSLNTLALD